MCDRLSGIHLARKLTLSAKKQSLLGNMCGEIEPFASTEPGDAVYLTVFFFLYCFEHQKSCAIKVVYCCRIAGRTRRLPPSHTWSITVALGD